MNNNKSDADREIEDRLSADIWKMIIDDIKSRGLDVDKFFWNKTKDENKETINKKFKIKYV